MAGRLSVEVLDAEAALVAGEGGVVSRGEFLKKALAAGGAIAAGGVVIAGLPRLATASAPSAAMDREILNYFLALEHLQEEFYDRALSTGALSGELKSYAETVRKNERDHMEYLKGVLGGDARDAPTFEFGDATSKPEKFQAAAVVIEETATAGYLGQGANLTRANVLSAARIVSVEARHSAWIRDILGRLPAPAAADTPKSQSQVMRTLRVEGWLK
jgi:hypothetical protein